MPAVVLERASAPESKVAAAILPGRHFGFLDGLRGLAALYVVLSHISLYVGQGNSDIVLLLTQWMHYGRSSVAVFIVLSGYCLMMPVVRSENNQLRGGLGEFLKRRACRIVPAYYATLAFAIVLMLLVPHKWIEDNNWWQTMQPSLTAGSLLSHIALVHNLSTQWVYKIDGPLWTVAMEWQIYFLFALLLLPVYRRFGLKAVVPSAFAIGLSPMLLLHSLEWTSPWYVGLFALGMVAAKINFSPQTRMEKIRQSIPWGIVSLSMLLAFIMAASSGRINSWFPNWKVQFAQDVWLGVACMCLLVSCTRSLLSNDRSRLPLIVGALQSRALITLGTFSYSLYLTHALVLAMTFSIVHQFGLRHDAEFLIGGAGTVVCSLLVGYGFYRLFEKPFMNTKRSSRVLLKAEPAL